MFSIAIANDSEKFVWCLFDVFNFHHKISDILSGHLDFLSMELLIAKQICQ